MCVYVCVHVRVHVCMCVCVGARMCVYVCVFGQLYSFFELLDASLPLYHTYSVY